VDSYRPHGKDRNAPAVIGLDGSVHIYALADKLPVCLHYEIQFRDKGGVVPQAVQDIMLQAAGTIDVPEGFTDEVFYLMIFGFPLVADDVTVVHWICFFRSYKDTCFPLCIIPSGVMQLVNETV
jgi:hypothetical protein